MDNTCAIRLKGLTKRFGSVVANDGIDLELRRGEILALLGENGVEVSHHFSALEEDGVLTVTLTAECEEELGRFIPAP